MKEPYHLSGALHVTGRSQFIGDGRRPRDMLVAKIFASTVAHGKISQLDYSKAQALAGVTAILTARDIPGQNQIGHPIADQPLLAEREVHHVGEPIAIVVAENEQIAYQALQLIEIKYDQLPTILSIEEAIRGKSYLAPKRKIERGSVTTGFADSDHVFTGEVTLGGQEHWYLETQRCWAIPEDDNEVTLYSSTQSTAAVQEIVAQVLNVASKDITVDVKRLGGAFGGKEGTSSIGTAAIAALAAQKTNQPVELKLTRLEDQAWTGKRHPFFAKYKIGCDNNGKILAYEVELYANGGAYTDLSMAVLERAMLHADNAYYLPNAKIIGYACRTNLPPNTAFRGFGGPQGVFVFEHAIERMVFNLKLDPVYLREINLYQEQQLTPYGQTVYEAYGVELLNRLKANSNYQQLQQQVAEFNTGSKFIKRGLGVVPIKFGVSFTASFLNQGSALLWIYADGTISLSHGGIEMGQEVNTKVAQVAAQTLGVSIDRIRIETANTKRVANASPTAASTGADINGHAAHLAAKELKQRLTKVAIRHFKMDPAVKPRDDDYSGIVFIENMVYPQGKEQQAISFAELAHHAYLQQVDLGCHSFYKTPGLGFDREQGQGTPFYYYVFGACLAEVAIDTMTGVYQVDKVYISHEIANSINQEIDRGQISGAFFQGYGWCTMEELSRDANGNYLAITPSTYKIPTMRDLPKVFEIDMLKAERQHSSVMGSKAVGEPPFLYGEAVYFALKNAVEATKDHQYEADLAMPATPEAVLQAINKLGESE